MGKITVNTVVDAQGAVLEKKEITSGTVDLVNGSITLQANHFIVRKDGVEVPSQSYGGINITAQGAGAPGMPGMPASTGNLTEAQVVTINKAKDTFFAVIKSTLESNVETVG